MRRLTFLCIVGCVLVSAAAPAEAQRRRTTVRVRTARVPDAGMIAVGGSGGYTFTASDFLSNGPEIAGNIEGYLTPRVSVRGQVGTVWRDITGLRYDGTVQPVFFLGNVVYNWEHGKWHPYATGGAGLYHTRFDEAGVIGSTNDFGVDFGGGVEYFFHLVTTLTGEGLYHAVQDINTKRSFFKGSFWSFMGGVKQYF